MQDDDYAPEFLPLGARRRRLAALRSRLEVKRAKVDALIADVDEEVNKLGEEGPGEEGALEPWEVIDATPEFLRVLWNIEIDFGNLRNAYHNLSYLPEMCHLLDRITSLRAGIARAAHHDVEVLAKSDIVRKTMDAAADLRRMMKATLDAILLKSIVDGACGVVIP
jgi:hypothetical protein